jgi:hypothetical protein
VNLVRQEESLVSNGWVGKINEVFHFPREIIDGQVIKIGVMLH